MAAVQRLRQGLRALFAFSQTVDFHLAEQWLSASQMILFRQMKRSEQLHSLNVLRDVLAQEAQTPADLAIAALLHDVGKTCFPLAIWQKTLAVLVRAGAPQVYHRWSKNNPQHRLFRAFAVAENHPTWSKTLVETTGASDTALWLIAHHADPLSQWDDHPYSKLLQRLKSADDAN